MSLPPRFGRYRVTRPIGRGAMGAVYLAEDPVIGRELAIKVIQVSEGLSDEGRLELQARFQREFRAAGTLSHPNIVTIYDVGDEGGQPFIAMEYVPGDTLESMLEGGRALPKEGLVDLIAGICGGLDYAHERGIVHRDVKPANILLGPGGPPKISDFGVAKLAESGMTRTGAIIGTPWYMSPEQVTGQPVSGASDQFSVAVIAYQILTGERPFTGERSSTILYKIVHVDPVSPRILNQRLSVNLEAVLSRALAKNPEQRYPTCGDLAQALALALGVTSVRAATEASSTRAGTFGDPSDSAAASSVARRPGGAAEAVTQLGSGLEAPPPSPPPPLAGAAASRREQRATPRRGRLLIGGLGAALLTAIGLWAWLSAGGEEAPLPTGEVPAAAEDLAASPRPPAPAAVPEERFTIASRPPGARVTLDGTLLGQLTPAEIGLDAGGRHTLILEQAGYEPASWSFSVADLSADQRRTRTLFFPLRASSGGTASAGTTVSPVETAPLNAAEMPPAAEPVAKAPPAELPSSSRVVDVRAGVQVDPPKKLVHVAPEVPPGKLDRQGVVVLELTIEPSGSVVAAKVLRGLDPELDQAAVSAARRWKYEPTLYRGRPARVVLSTTQQFPPR